MTVCYYLSQVYYCGLLLSQVALNYYLAVFYYIYTAVQVQWTLHSPNL